MHNRQALDLDALFHDQNSMLAESHGTADFLVDPLRMSPADREERHKTIACTDVGFYLLGQRIPELPIPLCDVAVDVSCCRILCCGIDNPQVLLPHAVAYKYFVAHMNPPDLKFIRFQSL